MAALTQLFTVEELSALDETDLEILRDAVLYQIRTSPSIRKILRGKTLGVYKKLTPKAKAKAKKKK